MSPKKPPISTDVAGAVERTPLKAQSRIKAETKLRGERTVSMTFFIPLSTHKRLQEIKAERQTSLQQLGRGSRRSMAPTAGRDLPIPA